MQIPREKSYQGKKTQCKGPGSASQRAWVRSSEEAMCGWREAFKKATGGQVTWTTHFMIHSRKENEYFLLR